MIIDSTVDPVLPLLKAVGKIATGLFVLTAGSGEAASATLVSFVQQLSFEPLCIGVSLHNGRSIGQLIEENRGFVINVCHAGDKNLLRRFARHALSGAEAFDGLATRRLDNGGVILLDACAYLWCDFSHKVDLQADHDLYIGIATLGDILGPDGAKPVVHIRHDGSRY